MLHIFSTHVASVLFGCYTCLQWFSSVFASASDVCFKYFIYLQTYVASVALHLDVSKVDRSIAYEMCVGNGRGRGAGPAWVCETQTRAGVCWHRRRLLALVGNESARATYRPTDGYPIGGLGASSSIVE
jgi:hypothetical protein